ncbi:hypothetical protein DYB32_002747 [Aphanomyces invadans]|uniref:Uncharacterized protein n=1 Tax=Aphanomyces invadans TaxID=157072 RepID=A0A418B2K5_9STRA|nr:hypothetical protein DYB32_002747 [Aphanomyces invadans]
MRSGWRRVLTAIPLLAATSPWNTAWSEAHTPKPRQRTKSISDKYEVGKVIGSGGFAVVKLAKDRTTGVEVAAKFFDMKTAWIGTHANIVSLRDVVYEPTDIIMIMDLVRGGELFDYIVSQVHHVSHSSMPPSLNCIKGSITEADASRMLREVCLALQHLHQRGETLHVVSNSWYNSLSDEAKDLLSHLLTVDPEKRFTAADALSHPWMNPRFRRRLSRRYRDGLPGRLQAYRRLQQLRANIVTVLLSQKLHKSPSGKHVVAPHTTDLETLNQDVYKEVFALFDEDQSGAISKHELANVLRALGQQYTPYEALHLCIFDVNHDGFISADELAYVMNVLDKTPISPAELHDLIRSIDENGDGKIDYKEFSTLMQAWLVEGRGQTKGK